MAQTTFDLSNRLYTILILFIAAISIGVAATAWSMLRVTGEYDQISVEGDATIELAPDLATVNLGVRKEAETSADAISMNTETMNAIIEAVKAAGIPEEDIQTQSLNLYPNYEWVDGEYEESGYEATQTVQIEVRDFDIIGEVIASASEAGANQVNGINFELENYEEELAAAREQAIAEAREKAATIAKASGSRLGKLTNYYEYTDDYGMYGGGGFYAESAAMDAEVLKAIDVPEIQAGQEEITLTVSLSYRVR